MAGPTAVLKDDSKAVPKAVAVGLWACQKAMWAGSGCPDGCFVGCPEGCPEGCAVGCPDGLLEGWLEGCLTAVPKAG